MQDWTDGRTASRGIKWPPTWLHCVALVSLARQITYSELQSGGIVRSSSNPNVPRKLTKNSREDATGESVERSRDKLPLLDHFHFRSRDRRHFVLVMVVYLY